jgi:hypothetical protein
VPNLVLTLLVLLDSIFFYKKRYARGAGTVSTMRWIVELAINILLGGFIPVVLYTIPELYDLPEFRADSPAYDVSVVYTIVMLSLASISL